MDPQRGLPGLKGYFDASGMFDERELCRTSPWYYSKSPQQNSL